MKMITAIVNKRDSLFVCDALRDEHIPFTTMATSGGFLRSGNVTLLIGVEDEQVEPAIETIRAHCSKRMEQSPYISAGGSFNPATPPTAEVLVGGATIFVTDVEHFEHI